MLLWVAVFVVALAAGFGLGALTYHPPDPGVVASGPQVPITPSLVPPPATAADVLPDVVGMQRAAAEKQLDAGDVLFLVNPVGGRDDDKVVSQNPAAGTPLGEAKHVLLDVRCRPKPCPMPPEGKQMYDPCACLWR